MDKNDKCEVCTKLLVPQTAMYPCSTKTAERFPETRNLKGLGKSGGRRGWIFQYLPSFGGVRTFSHHQFFCREWIRKSFPVDREGLIVLKSILPC